MKPSKTSRIMKNGGYAFVFAVSSVFLVLLDHTATYSAHFAAEPAQLHEARGYQLWPIIPCNSICPYRTQNRFIRFT